MPEEQNYNQGTTNTNVGWGAFSSFKKSGNTDTNNGFSSLTKLLIFLIPALLFASFYQYSVVKGATFFGVSLRHNVDLERGLVGHWTFDGADTSSTTVTDMSGNGNDGSLVDSPDTTIGKIGQALEYSSSSEYVAVSSFNETLSEATISGWVKFDEVSSCQGIILSRNGSGGSGITSFCNYPNDKLAYVWNDNVTTYNWDSGLTLPQNEWVFAVLIITSSKATMYLGTQSGLNSAENNVGHGSVTFDDLKFGTDEYDSEARRLRGSLDDVRIYNRALSVREIEALYKQGVGSKISVAPPSVPALEYGLVSHLTFDGPDTTSATATDVSGNGNYGQIYQAKPTIGKNGQALQFDGVDDAVYFEQITGMTGATDVPFTLSWWRKSNGSDEDEEIGWGPYRSCRSVGWAGGVVSCVVDGSGDPLFSSTAVDDNVWHHIVFTHDSGTQKIFVDGVLENTDDQVFTVGSYNISLGMRPFGGNFTGSLDDIRIYNRALSADEVTKLYSLENGTKINVTPPTAPVFQNDLVSHLTFDGPDTSSTTVTDVSGNGNDGGIVGATTGIGKIGQAMVFDGVDDEVYIDTIPGLTGATDVPFSWSFWISSYGFSTSGIDEIIGWSPYRRCRYLNFYVSYSVACSISGDEYSGSAVISTTLINDDQWHHVVYTHDSGVQKLYIDGSLEDTGSESFATDSYGFSLGTRPFGNYFGGKLDDFRMYSRAITADEVAQLYNLGR